MFAPVNGCLLAVICLCDYMMLWSAEIVQHHIISHMTPGQSLLSTPDSCELHNEVKLNWVDAALKAHGNNKLPTITFKPPVKHKKTKHFAHDSATMPFERPKYSSLPFKINTVWYMCHTKANHCGSGGTNSHMMSTVHDFSTQRATKAHTKDVSQCILYVKGKHSFQKKKKKRHDNILLLYHMCSVLSSLSPSYWNMKTWNLRSKTRKWVQHPTK